MGLHVDLQGLARKGFYMNMILHEQIYKLRLIITSCQLYVLGGGGGLGWLIAIKFHTHETYNILVCACIYGSCNTHITQLGPMYNS